MLSLPDKRAGRSVGSLLGWSVLNIINKSNLNTQHKPQEKCLDSAVVSGTSPWHNKAKYRRVRARVAGIGEDEDGD